MDGCSFASLIPTSDQLKTFLAILGAIVGPASAICAMWPPPRPGSRLAKLRGVLEIAALMVNQARQRKIFPAPPAAVESRAAEAVELLNALKKERRTTF